MKGNRKALESWLFGLLGHEERTFIIIRNLITDMLDNNKSGFKSEYIDMSNGEKYEAKLIVEKVRDIKVDIPKLYIDKEDEE